MAEATRADRNFRGVVTLGAQRARELREGATLVRTAELIGHSGEFHAGDWIYITARGHDGGQSVLAMGTAVVAFDQLGTTDPQVAVVEAVELLWPDAPAET